MGIKPFRASVIKKVTNRDSKRLFKELEHKYALAEEAGSRGFSNEQMEKRLKEMGYDPKRRKAVMSHIVGRGEIKSEDYKLSAKKLKNKYNLSTAEIKEIEKKRAGKKRMNILLGWESSGEVEKYIGDKGGYGAQRKGEKAKQKIYGPKEKTPGVFREEITEKHLGTVGSQQREVGYASDFAKKDNKNFSDKKSKVGPNPVGNPLTGVSGSLGGPSSAPPRIPLSR